MQIQSVHKKNNIAKRRGDVNLCAEKEYVSKIEEKGIKSVGFLKDLDEIPTQTGGKLCLGLECLDRDLWDFDRAFPLIKKLGVHRVRLQSGWQKTEKEKGIYDFAWLDHIVDSLLDAGIIPFLCLCYGNKLYCQTPEKCPNIENGGVGHMPAEFTEEREAWVKYAAATVEHFKDRIQQYEIWNEPDVGAFCRTNLPWMDAYVELVKLTAPAIRKAYPQAEIISCSAHFDNVKRMMDVNIHDYVDIHSFHGYVFYTEMLSCDTRINGISHLKAAKPHLKLWRGEAGCPSYNDPRSNGALHEIEATEIKQAKFLLRHLMGDLYNDDIELTSYFHAYDFVHFSGACRYFYGLIRHEPLSKKPSFNCFQVLTHLFDGDVRRCNTYRLSFADRMKNGLTEEQILAIKFLSFEKNGKVFFAYYFPKEITDDVFADTVQLTVPYMDGQMKKPVIVDLFTRKIYAAENNMQFTAPLTDYPMLVMDFDTVKDLAVIDTPENAPADTLTEYYEQFSQQKDEE